MKKLILSVFLILLFGIKAYAIDEIMIEHNMAIQKHIDSIGFNILNRNKIDKPIMFTYDFENPKKFKGSGVKNHKVVIYDMDYNHADNDDEIAAFLAMKISYAYKNYDNSSIPVFGNFQARIMPKRHEIFNDKRAVDLMVNAGYNPLGLITYITKTRPQKNYDFLSHHNLTSKRLAIIYEQIFTKYPYFLTNNTYLDNEYYQNFLLNSVENRQKLEAKLQNNSTYEINYD